MQNVNVRVIKPPPPLPPMQVHMDRLPPRLHTLSLQNARVVNAHLAAARLPRLDTLALYAGEQSGQYERGWGWGAVSQFFRREEGGEVHVMTTVHTPGSHFSQSCLPAH